MLDAHYWSADTAITPHLSLAHCLVTGHVLLLLSALPPSSSSSSCTIMTSSSSPASNLYPTPHQVERVLRLQVVSEAITEGLRYVMSKDRRDAERRKRRLTLQADDLASGEGAATVAPVAGGRRLRLRRDRRPTGTGAAALSDLSASSDSTYKIADSELERATDSDSDSGLALRTAGNGTRKRKLEKNKGPGPVKRSLPASAPVGTSKDNSISTVATLGSGTTPAAGSGRIRRRTE